MADTEDPRPSWQLLTLIGMVAGVSLGAVVVIVLRDQERRAVGASAGASALPPINIWNISGGSGERGAGPSGLLPPDMPAIGLLPGMEPTVPGTSAAQSPQVSMNTQMATVQLSNTRINRLWYAAGNNPWSIDVSADGPPGSFAYISTEASALNPGFAAQSNVLSIAAGQHRTVRLQPGQDLYALANISGATNDDNVHVSIVASEGSLRPSYG